MIIELLITLIFLVLTIINGIIDILIPNRFSKYFHLVCVTICLIGLLLCFCEAIICIIAEVL